MTAPLDLLGRRFGKLLVQYRFGTDKHGKTLWACWCDCGRTTITRTAKLTHGQASCGPWCGHVAKPRRQTQARPPVGLDLWNVWLAAFREIEVEVEECV